MTIAGTTTHSGNPATIDVTEAGYWSNPHPRLAEARERHRLARLEPFGAWALLRYQDVEAGFKDPRLVQTSTEMFAAMGITEGPIIDWWRHTPIALDPPEHTRVRGTVARAFTPRRSERIRGLARSLAQDIVERGLETGRLEIVRELADVIPVRVISAMMGVPEGDYKQFAKWTKDIALALAAVIPPEARAVVEDALVGLYDYVTRLLDERRKNPRDDLLSALVAAESEGERLSLDELNALVVGLLFGGHDTTKSLLSIATWALATHPDQLRLLREDSAGRIEGAIEEILRWEPAVVGTIRRAAEPIEIDGTQIAPGELVTLSILAANRDPRAFPDPDRFDILRPQRTHLTFGHGIHFCVGASLARAESQEVIRVLFDRAEVEPEIDAPKWVPLTAIRLMETLPVRLRPRM